MNIGSNNSGVAGRLSNFTPRKFVFMGVECNSMEGLLQSFKFDKPHIQKEVCKLSGFEAKKRGSKRNKQWKTGQILWWDGVPYGRKSIQYQDLLQSAFNALAKNDKFAKDILSTGDSSFTHTIGKRKECDTVLTEREFCQQLYRVRLNTPTQDNSEVV